MDKSTGLFVILTAPLIRLIGWSMRQKVVDSAICTTWIYNCTLIMVIYGLGMIVISRLRVGMLGRSSLEVRITIKILRRLFFFYKSN